MSLAERDKERRYYRDKAIARAEGTGLTMRCLGLRYDLLDPGHQLCRGEDLGNAGCLCRCHDNPGAEILARTDERT